MIRKARLSGIPLWKDTMSPKRVDRNHGRIVQSLRKRGASVFSLATLGKGVPDICIGFQQRTMLAEIKTKTGKLNAMQRNWHDTWNGEKVVVLRTSEDVEQLLRKE